MNRTLARLVALLAALVLLSSACGNSTGDEAADQPSDTGSTDTESAASTEELLSQDQRDKFVEITGVPGVTDEEIAYTIIGTKTGNPLGICILDCYADGIRAYFAWRNDQGGIYGRDLVINQVIDDELAKNQQRSIAVASSGDAFGVFQATLLPGGWGDLAEAGIPTYAWGIHPTAAANRESIFPSTIVQCADCTHPVIPWVAQKEGATKAASLGYGVSENSKVCAQMVADSFRRYEDQTGVEMVYVNDDLQYGLPNGIGPEVTAMKQKGVDFISTCIDLNGMKTLAQELKRQGMQDVVLYHPNSYDQTFLEESNGLFEGDIVTVQFRPFEANPGDSTMQEYLKWIEEIGRAPSELSMVGWINASVAFDGLLAAGPEFTREEVIDATNSLEDYTIGGLYSPIDMGVSHTAYTAADPAEDAAPECSVLVKVVDGEFVPYVDPDKPWLCWEGWDTDNMEPTSKNFD